MRKNVRVVRSSRWWCNLKNLFRKLAWLGRFVLFLDKVERLDPYFEVFAGACFQHPLLDSGIQIHHQLLWIRRNHNVPNVHISTNMVGQVVEEVIQYSVLEVEDEIPSGEILPTTSPFLLKQEPLCVKIVWSLYSRANGLSRLGHVCFFNALLLVNGVELARRRWVRKFLCLMNNAVALYVLVEHDGFGLVSAECVVEDERKQGAGLHFESAGGQLVSLASSDPLLFGQVFINLILERAAWVIDGYAAVGPSPSLCASREC
ncbi:hypothetical protein OGAPHI_004822 [Ogataea philodendri]|uniref:Uncharacterized protein n=1 Tax=Ogataea philodendri TaxID=1378263 RepID=A0A9P8P225_9ASCO|nr:uncharacterized protein OGAPHI_004822 [Ogataea philodendri]KAH3664108.1 hypothetical protein OGAPHI_004822 [Ogataea philodendri]